MEQKLYTDDFEKMLKEKSDDFKMIPSRRVWHSIYNDLHPSRRWPSVAMSLLLIGTLLFTGYLNTGNSRKNNLPNASSANNTDNNSSSASSHSLSDVQPQAPATNNLFNLAAANRDVDVNGNSNSNARSNKTVGNHLYVAFKNVHGSNSRRHSSANDNTSKNSLASNSSNRFPHRNRAANGRLMVAVENGRQTPMAVTTMSSTDDLSASSSQYKNKTASNTQPDLSIVTEDINIVTITSTSLPEQDRQNGIANAGINSKNANTTSAEKNSLKTTAAIKPAADNEQKAWMEDYALHNKASRKRWKGNISWELYATPSLTYRTLSNNSKYAVTAPIINNQGPLNTIMDTKLAHKMAPGIELGGNLIYAFAKNFRFKTGVQLNYTNYNIDAFETNHPVLTTITLNDINSGYPYQASRSTSLSTVSGLSAVTLHSKTYQVSAIAGLDVKLYGKENLKWYAGASIQPSYIAGGKVYLLSTDHRSYVADNSMLRKFNLATAFETYMTYKAGSVTWQIGPEFRYQLMSTYDKRYNQQENLFNTGIKIGIVKLF